MKHLIALISDTHFGSTIAPSPKRFVRDDGDTYSPTKFQQWLNYNWQQYWEWVETFGNGAQRLSIIHVGDIVDGTNHHGNTQAVSSNTSDEIRLAIEMLTDCRKKADHFYCIRGTNAHSGEASWREEQVAIHLNAVKHDHRSTWDLLKLQVQGKHIHAYHHGKVGRTLQNRNAPARADALQHILLANQNRYTPADLIVRGHAHMKADSGIDLSTRVIQLPTWQGKNNYAQTFAGDENQMADIGGALLIVEHGELDLKWKLFRPDEQQPIVME